MATLEQLSAALIKADAAGNTADAKAFADAIRQMQTAPSGGIPVGRKGIEAIPVEAGANTAPTVAPQSKPGMLGETLGGLIETPIAVGANLLSGPVTYLAGAGGPEFQSKVAGAIQYQPRTQMAQEALAAVGRGFEASKLPPYMGAIGGPVGGVKPAIRAIGDLGNAQALNAAEQLAQPLVNRANAKAQINLAKSYANAPQIEAAQAAQRIGVALPPEISNPTAKSKVVSTFVGHENIVNAANKANENKWTSAVKQDLGLPVNSSLNAQAFDEALNKASKPYDVVRRLSALQPTDTVVASLESARIPEQIGGKNSAAAVNTLVDHAQELLSQGRSGAAVLDDIRQLRRNANNIYQSQKVGMAPDPAQLAQADASIKIANSLEDLIDANVQDPRTLAEIKKARTRMAQIFDFERATSPATGRVDPQVFAKMLEENKPLTGVARDIGMVAANYPSIAKVSVGGAPIAPRLTRSGVGGTIGYGLGTLTGTPVLGAILGAGAGEAINTLGARRVVSPAYQAANALPIDYRPPVNAMRPVEPRYTPGQPVPYDYSQQTFTPPNFVMQGNQYAPQVTPGIAPIANALPAPNASATMNALRAEQQRAGGMSRTLGQQAEAQQAAAEAASRRPTSGAVELQINPLTGVPEISAGVKGATPEVFMANTGASLQSAAAKLAAGKAFDMTLAEKAAWKATRTDLAEILPGFKALDEKTIASKMMDRAWVDNAIAKARQEAQAFDQIASRAADARAKSNAIANRERMLDLAEKLQDALGTRPVKRGGQGPKTRAFQRNMLTPEQEIQNALAQ
jgi:hypothetical protein